MHAGQTSEQASARALVLTTASSLDAARRLPTSLWIRDTTACTLTTESITLAAHSSPEDLDCVRNLLYMPFERMSNALAQA